MGDLAADLLLHRRLVAWRLQQLDQAMPTTILDNETYPEALQRRYAEEAKAEERMTTKLEQAARQALEALEALNPYPASKENRRFDAITALREALAEQAEQEPCIECGRPTMSAESKCNDCHSMDDTAPQPVSQVPVAWIEYDTQGNFSGLYREYGEGLCEEDFANGWRLEPLYAAPVRTKDLTEFEIMDVYLNGGGKENGEIGFARAIEAKIKEKNCA